MPERRRKFWGWGWEGDGFTHEELKLLDPVWAKRLGVSEFDVTPPQISQLLVAWSNGDQAAVDQLMPLVYGELRRMAKRYMAGQPPGHTLQTTALIHEAYLKLVGQEDKRWQNRAHFFGVAAQAMRHILVDYARARHAAKRGGALRAVDNAQALSSWQ